ncbi:hypothetical protein CDA63_07120 [Hymenobacter amundsenii]|uniref:histidine kinase n=1 Tax=Hymenobacter amundsenii TaxID=2006685 RepID=A0A246FPR2_9BACT|nr:PAS domain S-box protein [Hymenobacter amundsenii]OWP63754.1 hypothetical protein CDA63_07120 [Hymenobacter amundsenii]
MDSISFRHQNRQLRQARRQLAELRARSQAATDQAAALLQTMTTAILAEDQRHIVTLLNPRLCDLLGLAHPPAYYIGQPLVKLLRETRPGVLDYDGLREQNKQLVTTQARSNGLLVKLRGGQIIQQDYLPVVHDGTTMLHIWSYEDVTEQQSAQHRVQELSRLAEQSPQPIIRFRPDCHPLYANPAAAPILAALAHPNGAATCNLLCQAITQVLAGTAPHTLELEVGNEFYLCTIAPLPDEQEANVYLTAISERRRAEAELIRSQLFTARINDTVPTIVFIYNADTHGIEYCNRQVEPVLGYTPDEIVAMGPALTQRLLHPDDLGHSNDKQRMLRTLPDGEVLRSEYRLRHQDGSWRWLSMQSTCFTRHPNGRPWQIVGAVTDITERRETEQLLRQSQLFVERITNTIPNLVYIYDVVQEANVYCNRFVEGILGYTAEELQEWGHQMLTKLLPPAEAAKLHQHFLEVARQPDDEILHLEAMFHHRNGSVRWLRVSNTPFARDAQGQVTQILGSAEDITRWKVADEQRRSANRRLAEQNRLFRQVIDTVPNLIYLKDHLGRYVLVNEATAQFFNLSNEALLQVSPAELLAQFPDLTHHRVQDEEVLRSRQEIDMEKSSTDANQQQRWFRTVKRPFVRADGTVQVLGVDHDITELKQTQQALEQAKEAAEQNAQARQNFLTNMSHEIRTPMNGIMGLTELLAKTPLNPEQQELLHHVEYSSQNLLVIINDILDMAQLGAGRVRLEHVPFDLAEVLRASCQALLPQATGKGIGLRLQLPANASSQPIWVLGDPFRLRQILLNLLSNAIKFTNKGQVLLTYQRVANLAGEASGTGRYQFSVLDTGIGISPDQLQHLFEPFTQASASTAREYGGSGLGLSISRGLVELLGGELTAESRPGHGSTFRFVLELPAAPTPDLTLPVPPPDYQRLSGHHILLTEDNAVNQLLVRTMLQGWGLKVDTASSGAEALALFREHHYSLVLMDIQMPGMDGVATTRLLRQHPNPARAATPVVALTAHAMPGDAERYRTAGLDDYLSKPFREAALFEVMAGLLDLDRRPANCPEPLALPQVASASTLAPVGPNLAPPAPAAPLYDLEQLRRMSDNDDTFVQRLVALFIRTTPPVIAEMEQHLAARQLELLGAAAHHLRSSTDGLQVQSLRTVLRDMEDASRTPDTAPDWPQLTTDVELVRTTIDEVIRQLREAYPA